MMSSKVRDTCWSIDGTLTSGLKMGVASRADGELLFVDAKRVVDIRAKALGVFVQGRDKEWYI